MYNDQVKCAFIQRYTASDQTEKLVRGIFDRMQGVEEKYDTDFYAMNTEQAQEAFTSVTGTRIKGANTILMILKAYVRWCVANGYPASNSVQDVRLDVYDKFKEGYVASPLHLKETLDVVFYRPDLNGIEYIYRTYFWLAFMGLQVSEAIQVKDSDIDFDNMRLKFFDAKRKKEERFPMYVESLPDFRQAKVMKTISEPRGTKGVSKDRASGNELLRGKVSKRTLEEAITLTYRPVICRTFKETPQRYEREGKEVPKTVSLKLTYNHAYMSGIFYRMYERERMGIPPDFDEIVLRERRNVTNPHYPRGYSERKLLNILIKNMGQDYENWKSVFG